MSFIQSRDLAARNHIPGSPRPGMNTVGKNNRVCGIIKIRWGEKAFGLLMFVYVWVRTEICQCEMNAE